MVQTSSIAVFASVALFAVSPAFGAVLPNNKPASSVSASTTRAAATTTTTAGTTKPTYDAAKWKKEQELIDQISKLDSTKPNNARPLQNLKQDDKTKTTTSSTPSATPTGKVLGGKPAERLAEKQRLDKLRTQKLELEEQRERLKMKKLDQEIAQERLVIHGLDRERLAENGAPAANRLNKPTISTSTTTSATTTATPRPFALNRLVQSVSSSSSAAAQPTGRPWNPVQQASIKMKEHALVEELESLVSGNKVARDSAEDAQWVRGYDNSENDARDFDEDEDVFARGYDDSDAEYVARDDLEGFEYALRDLDSDVEDLYQRFDFEGLEDLE